jgi:hypothetical protein
MHENKRRNVPDDAKRPPPSDEGMTVYLQSGDDSRGSWDESIGNV